MRREIFLHGPLKEKYGDRFELEIATPAEAFRALAANLPGFDRDIRDGEFQIFRGPIDAERDTGVDELAFSLGRTKQLHIVPVIGGAKRGGGAKAIIGALIMVAAMVIPGMQPVAMVEVAGASEVIASTAVVGLGTPAFTVFGTAITYGNIAMFGLSMAIGGVMQMLSPQPKSQSLEPVDRKPSFLFTGAVNASAQGNAVPLVYGRIRVGSVVVSAGVEAIEIT